MDLSKSFYRGAALSFFGLLLLAEVFLRVAVPSGLWHKMFDPSGEMTSLADVQDRLRYDVPAGPSVLLLGDSVLGASALVDHRLAGARSKTLSSFLREDLKAGGLSCLSLGSDGLLLPDIQGLSSLFSSRPPTQVLILLNFRMFAKDYAQGPKALSRDFLTPQLSDSLRSRLAPPQPPSQETLLGDRLYAAFCRHWFLFREAQVLKTIWYYPSRTDFFQRLLEKAVGRSPEAEDIAEAALKQKILSFYQAPVWDPGGVPFEALGLTLEEWAKLKVPVTVILTPQNKKFLGSRLDAQSFEKNRAALASFFKAPSRSNVRYEDWSGRFPVDFFFDHCHLTPAGNEQYAKDLAGILLGREGK